VTRATGTGTTVIEEVPATPSLVAVIVALPSATAETIPLAETVATEVFSEVQVAARPVRRLSRASLI
jgi:hypothetical protein